jgi:hypothetical protein
MIAATVLGSGSSQAQYEGPWCAIEQNGEGSVREICHFRTIEACIAEVVAGNRGTCGHNPRYAGPQTEGRSARHVARHHRHRH